LNKPKYRTADPDGRAV